MGRPVRIAIAGEGGQGVQSAAEILAEAAALEGKEALYIPNFGIEQRGGVSVAYVQIGDERIGSPKFRTGDVVVALSCRAVDRVRMHVGPETLFIYDSLLPVAEEDLPEKAQRVMALPALETANRRLHPRVFNVLVLGAVIGATGVVTLEKAREAIERRLGYRFEKSPKLRDLNFRALQEGFDLAAGAKAGTR